jgi:hypothetical protein
MSGLPYNKLKNKNQECKKTYQSWKLAKQMTWSFLRDCTKWLLKQKEHRKRHEPQEVHKPYVQVKKTLRCPSPSTPPPRNTFNHRKEVNVRKALSRTKENEVLSPVVLVSTTKNLKNKERLKPKQNNRKYMENKEEEEGTKTKKVEK